MAPNTSLIPFLVGMMLLTGVCNTLLTKYQDMQCVGNCDSTDPARRRLFEQPVWQTAQMFVGEMGCWLVVAGSALYSRMRTTSSYDAEYEPLNAQGHSVVDDRRDSAEIEDANDDPASKPLLGPVDEDKEPLHGWRVFLLALPACCDIAGTTLMNVGLLFVAASIYQMTRGALVLFVGVFSVVFLRRKLGVAKWMALFVVVGGVAIVGVAGATEQKDAALPRGDSSPSRNAATVLLSEGYRLVRSISPSPSDNNDAVNAIIGISLIFLAQLFTASQFVLEEAIMHRYSLGALAVVGWEGTFGLLVTLTLMLILHFAYGRTPAGAGGYFDAVTGWRELTGHTAIWVSTLLIMVSIGGFNFFGLSVTRNVSATSRSTIDTCRTLFIWVISLGLGWEVFKWAQLAGFALLVYGTFLFNEIIRPPGLGWLRRWGRVRVGELLPERVGAQV